ncbi:hypothetical protein [Winogradskyella luteola]|uniref:Uncharacterized protein n=1 Tax=Winogradskyella luteola TaxID=2828330 RepID=A0A9X1F8X7_9FLAO|nr:hypothetical protein [Winogradskyella luteola]MBV7269672.1 hypothetical protein [Winogradskyella luteola]
MAKKRIIKCISCGVYNENRESCKNCGAVISYEERRKAHIKKESKKRIEAVKKEPPSFIENLKGHHFLAYRALGWLLYSGFVVVSAIGAFLAWLIFAIAAG